MRATKHLNGRSLATALCGVVAVVGVAGCAGFRVERDGRKTGDAICDIKNADNAEDAKSALADAQKWNDKAVRITGRPVDEDIRDVKENLDDLAKHASSGASALAQQDIAVIRRNVESVIRVTTSRAQRYYEGVDEGLSNCSD